MRSTAASNPNGQAADRPGARFETIHTLEEMVAEFEYRPVACHRSYRVIVVLKLLGRTKARCACSRSIATSSISPTTA